MSDRASEMMEGPDGCSVMVTADTVTVCGPTPDEVVDLTREQARWLFQIGGPTVLYRTEPERKGRR